MCIDYALARSILMEPLACTVHIKYSINQHYLEHLFTNNIDNWHKADMNQAEIFRAYHKKQIIKENQFNQRHRKFSLNEYVK